MARAMVEEYGMSVAMGPRVTLEDEQRAAGPAPSESRRARYRVGPLEVRAHPHGPATGQRDGARHGGGVRHVRGDGPARDARGRAARRRPGAEREPPRALSRWPVGGPCTPPRTGNRPARWRAPWWRSTACPWRWARA